MRRRNSVLGQLIRLDGASLSADPRDDALASIPGREQPFFLISPPSLARRGQPKLIASSFSLKHSNTHSRQQTPSSWRR